MMCVPLPNLRPGIDEWWRRSRSRASNSRLAVGRGAAWWGDIIKPLSSGETGVTASPSILLEQSSHQQQLPDQHTGAVVIGSDYRGLGIVRSLGRRGIPVWVLSDGHLLAAVSRYAQHQLPWPVDHGEQRRLEYLLALGRRHALRGWTLFPTGDETAAFLARQYTRLSGQFRLTTCPWEVLRWAYDKRLSYQLADELGLPVPWTAYPTSEDEVAGLDCPWPVILKPAIKTTSNPFTVAKAWRVNDRRALLARYAEARVLVASPLIMVQELIPGGGETQFSYAALCQDGRVIAHIVARRTRQYPMDFGPCQHVGRDRRRAGH